jgi:hypothetical protein
MQAGNKDSQTRGIRQLEKLVKPRQHNAIWSITLYFCSQNPNKEDVVD